VGMTRGERRATTRHSLPLGKDRRDRLHVYGTQVH